MEPAPDPGPAPLGEPPVCGRPGRAEARRQLAARTARRGHEHNGRQHLPVGDGRSDRNSGDRRRHAAVPHSKPSRLVGGSLPGQPRVRRQGHQRPHPPRRCAARRSPWHRHRGSRPLEEHLPLRAIPVARRNTQSGNCTATDARHRAHHSEAVRGENATEALADQWPTGSTSTRRSRSAGSAFGTASPWVRRSMFRGLSPAAPTRRRRRGGHRPALSWWAAHPPSSPDRRCVPPGRPGLPEPWDAMWVRP